MQISAPFPRARTESRFQFKIFICHWESNCFITRKSRYFKKRKKKKIISSLFELIFLLSSFIQRFRCNSLRFHFSRRISSIFHRGNGLKLEGLNESKANVNGKAEGSSSTVETLFLYPFRDTIRHNIAH